MLELKDVTKIYYTKNKAVQTIALKNVNLTIGKGEFVAVTGDSGSGKTTLLNMLGAVDTPTSGRVLFQGKDLSLLSSDKRAEHRNKYTGFVFQRFYLDPNLTVSENVALPLTIQGVAAAERKKRVIELLDEYHLSDKADVFPDELSGGQMQRVALCRALVNNPLYILADEPTGNLDSKLGSYIIEKFRAIADKGITVIMVTHNAVHTALCDRTVVIKDGEV